MFYIETFKIWCKLNYKEPESITEIIKQSLWDNDIICINKKTVRYNKWKQAGIKYIIDIIDNNGKIASSKYLKNKFGINIKHLEYQSLIHSLRKHWKKTINHAQNIIGTVVPDVCTLKIGNKYQEVQEIATRDIYNHLINTEKSTPPTGKQRWIEIYDGMELNEDYWALIYGTPFLLTKNSKSPYDTI